MTRLIHDCAFSLATKLVRLLPEVRRVEAHREFYALLVLGFKEMLAQVEHQQRRLNPVGVDQQCS